MKLTRSSKTGVYSVTIATAHGRRTISTGVRNKEDARQVIKRAKIRELELTARSVRLTREVVSQLLVGRKVTTTDAFTEWQEWLGTHVAPKTALNHETNVNAWLRDEQLTTVHVNAITEKNIDRWINDPNGTDKASSRAVRLSALRSFFKFCALRQYVMADPTLGVRVKFHLLSHAQKERREKRPFTEEELAALLTLLESQRQDILGQIAQNHQRLIAQGKPPGSTGRLGGKFKALEERQDALTAQLHKNRFWHAVTLLGRHTGLRLGDICCLEWASLEKPDVLIVWTDKTDTRVEVPIPAELCAEFDSIPRTTPTWCFPNEHALYSDLKRRSLFSVEFARLCRKAGIKGHSFHDLRRAYINACREAGIPMPHIARLVGHASERMTEHYVH